MHLTYNREWFAKYDPTVFIVSEFIYDKGLQIVPFLVGPTMLEKFGQQVPTGMIFSDSRVAGLHPYRGGSLTLTVILFRLQRQNYARKLLQLVESAAHTLDFSSALPLYLKVSNIIMDGIESLLGLGDLVPLTGIRKEIDLHALNEQESAYFALIDMPESELNTDHLRVRKNQLVYGQTFADARPFREADFVLYSVGQISERSDVTTLPFYPLYEKVVQDAMKADNISWQSAKASLTTLRQAMILSPDLTLPQADALYQDYKAQIVSLHNEAIDNAVLGPEKGTLSEEDIRLREAVDILNL